ncbi:MAG: hypothetical protein IJS05_08335 [Paludibacteraceae bacterium]|nr:hypothetical protein [Paludibacteraceae bacterium]
MKIGFIKPNYPFEKRVALFPNQVSNIVNECIVEKGFGEYLEFTDTDYLNAGAKVLSRSEVFKQCNVIFALKLLQPSDYEYIREGQIIVGWIHPSGSGKQFMIEQALPKNLIIIDLDNIYPKIYYKNKSISIPFIRPNFIYRNSYIAGKATVLHALLSNGRLPDSNTQVAILSAGNVAQGAFDVLAKLGASIRLFNRRSMPHFLESVEQYDIIVSGIEMDTNEHLLSLSEQQRIKKGALVIDAAADAGNTFEGLDFTTIGEPIRYKNGVYWYCVNNAPSLLYRESSEVVSQAFEKVFYNSQIQDFLDLI